MEENNGEEIEKKRIKTDIKEEYTIQYGGFGVLFLSLFNDVSVFLFQNFSKISKNNEGRGQN